LPSLALPLSGSNFARARGKGRKKVTYFLAIDRQNFSVRKVDVARKNPAHNRIDQVTKTSVRSTFLALNRPKPVGGKSNLAPYNRPFLMLRPAPTIAILGADHEGKAHIQ
jgi:hypothetical protein